MQMSKLLSQLYLYNRRLYFHYEHSGIIVLQAIVVHGRGNLHIVFCVFVPLSFSGRHADESTALYID